MTRDGDTGEGRDVDEPDADATDVDATDADVMDVDATDVDVMDVDETDADASSPVDAAVEGADATEVVRATGHEHVRATHESTLEVTTDDYLTPAGDCIVGIEADRAPADFDPAFVAACRDEAARIVARLSVDDPGTRRATGTGTDEARVVGRGDPELPFESERGAVLRTSDYVDERTVLVGADRAAADLDRDLVEALADGAELTVEFAVWTGEGS